MSESEEDQTLNEVLALLENGEPRIDVSEVKWLHKTRAKVETKRLWFCSTALLAASLLILSTLLYLGFMGKSVVIIFDPKQPGETSDGSSLPPDFEPMINLTGDQNQTLMAEEETNSNKDNISINPPTTIQSLDW